jgi:putative hydrolase of the HAD superfamily
MKVHPAQAPAAFGGVGSYRAILFDLDDTLYSRRAVFAQWVEAYLRDTLQLTDADEISRVRAVITTLDGNGYGSKQAIFEHLHTLYPGLPGEPSRSVETFFHEFLSHLTPDPDTEALLDTLAHAALPFGVITNGSVRQWRKIEKLGLDKRTTCLFVSETFGVKKPAPAIFHAAAQHLGVSPAHILFVGDNPAADIGGAHSAGMSTAWLHRNQPWPEEIATPPDFVIDSLSEVAAIVGISLSESSSGAV